MKRPALIALLLAFGCARVKPWERAKLAERCMEQSLNGAATLDERYRSKMLESRAGGGLPGSAPGGGCGCTQ